MITELENLIKDAKSKNIPFSNASFNKSVDDLIQKHYFDNKSYSNVKESFEGGLYEKLNLTPDEEEQLVNLQKLSPFIDDKDSAKKFLPIALYNIRNKKIDYSTLSSLDGGELDSSVEYFTNDTQNTDDFNKENIQFAAQLYYVMVMGDELEVFNAADALITKHLRNKRFNVDVRKKATLDAIRLYAFNDKFEHLKTGETFQRSQEPERMMFYKQVFDMGDVQQLGEMEANTDFIPLWDTLMVEVAKYIAKVEESSNYDNISRNNIYQAIEDLQYNLSNNCTGLSKIASNVMYLELKFIENRLFADKDIREQIGKRDRTPFGVLKQILLDLNEQRGMRMQDIIALNNKAILGHKIINEIAKFTQEYMETDENFGKFITDVQAYFLAQKIIEKQTNTLFDSQDMEPSEVNETVAPEDEWDF
jgi:hypothetical protein